MVDTKIARISTGLNKVGKDHFSSVGQYIVGADYALCRSCMMENNNLCRVRHGESVDPSGLSISR